MFMKGAVPAAVCCGGGAAGEGLTNSPNRSCAAAPTEVVLELRSAPPLPKGSNRLSLFVVAVALLPKPAQEYTVPNKQYVVVVVQKYAYIDVIGIVMKR